MGCSAPKEKLEDEMMLMKLKRMEIQMEKEKELKKLSEMEGKPVQRGIVPDYIDPAFAKEKKLYDEDNPILNDKKTDISGAKKKSPKTIKAKSEVTKKKVKRDKGKDKMSESTNKKKKKVK